MVISLFPVFETVGAELNLADLAYTNAIKDSDEIILQLKDATSSTGYRTRRLSVSNLVTFSIPITNNASYHVYKNNIVTGPSGYISTAGTTTAGIQEAYNYAITQGRAANSNSPFGLTIKLEDPVAYFITNTIWFWDDRTNASTTILKGDGSGANGIVYVENGQGPRSAIRIGKPGTFNRSGGFIRDMFISSTTNACTNIIFFDGSSSGGGGAPYGGVYGGEVNHCWVGWWKYMTNNPQFGFAPGEHNNANEVKNLVGVDVDCNYNGSVAIENNFFIQCLGIGWATDHGKIRNNQFGPNGRTSANNWPSASPFAALAQITTKNGVGGLANGNTAWDIGANTFISGEFCYFFGDSSVNPVYLVGDQVESGLNYVVSNGKRAYVINPLRSDVTGHNQSWEVFTNNYVFGGSDFSYATISLVRDSTNCVQISMPPTNRPSAGFVRTTDGIFEFWNDGQLVKSNTLSHIPILSKGDNYYWSSNGIAYVICSSPSGVLTTNKIAP